MSNYCYKNQNFYNSRQEIVILDKKHLKR